MEQEEKEPPEGQRICLRREPEEGAGVSHSLGGMANQKRVKPQPEGSENLVEVLSWA